MIAKVEPLTPARSLRGPFDYRLAGALEDVGVGSMLVVPFGRRRLLGVVVDVAAESDLPPERLAEPIAALEADVPQSLVALGLWVAREYVSTPARGLALVLPPGTGTGAGRPLRPKRSLRAAITPAGEAALHEGARMGAKQRAALEELAGAPLGAAALARRTDCTHSTLRSLERRGLIRLESAAEAPKPPARARGGRAGAKRVAHGGPGGGVRATSRSALVGARALAAPLLLHGVTGSGKTEVYLRSVAAALERGQSAIVLVPEIALTPQTAGRFVERFGDQVAVMHSRLSPRERYDEWWRMRRGEARVCVGPRSAVFAPFDDLGLIIVDEEHDGSYKQEGDPRYDARAVAERRAADEGALLVAGTATPRPESHGALRADPAAVARGRPRAAAGGARRDGRHRRAAPRAHARGARPGPPRRREGDRPAEPARMVELPVVPRLRARVGVPALRRHARAAPRARRGVVPPLRPPRAGAAGMPGLRIGVGGAPRRGHRAARARARGAGRAAAGVQARLGRGGGRGGGDGAAALRRGATAGVLVGTQMVAKGHDFPDVTLGVVLDADATLRFPDFRAEERTFALVAQLAGRSGRGERGGRVIVQALDPTAEALRFAARHDADGFLEVELGRRELLGYPPHGHLIRVVCSSTERGARARRGEGDPRARVGGRRARARPRAALPPPGAPPRPARDPLAGPRRAIAAVRDAVETVAAMREHASASFAVDVDPQ